MPLFTKKKKNRIATSWSKRLFLVAASIVFLGSCTGDLTQRYWKQSDEYFRKGQYPQAIAELNRVVASKVEPEKVARALHKIAVIYAEYLKDYPNAIKTYRQVYEVTEVADLKMLARWEIAKIYRLSVGAPKLASEEYENLFEEFGTTRKEGPTILLEWCETLNEAGLPAMALGQYKRFVELYPAHIEVPRVTLLEGQSLLNAKKGAEAALVFSRIIENYGAKNEFRQIVAEAHFGKGQSLELQDKIQDAIEVYKQASRDYPNPDVVNIKINRLSQRIKKRRE